MVVMNFCLDILSQAGLSSPSETALMVIFMFAELQCEVVATENYFQSLFLSLNDKCSVLIAPAQMNTRGQLVWGVQQHAVLKKYITDQNIRSDELRSANDVLTEESRVLMVQMIV